MKKNNFFVILAMCLLLVTQTFSNNEIVYADYIELNVIEDEVIEDGVETEGSIVDNSMNEKIPINKNNDVFVDDDGDEEVVAEINDEENSVDDSIDEIKEQIVAYSSLEDTDLDVDFNNESNMIRHYIVFRDSDGLNIYQNASENEKPKLLSFKGEEHFEAIDLKCLYEDGKPSCYIDIFPKFKIDLNGVKESIFSFTIQYKDYTKTFEGKIISKGIKNFNFGLSNDIFHFISNTTTLNYRSFGNFFLRVEDIALESIEITLNDPMNVFKTFEVKIDENRGNGQELYIDHITNNYDDDEIRTFDVTIKYRDQYEEKFNGSFKSYKEHVDDMEKEDLTLVSSNLEDYNYDLDIENFKKNIAIYYIYFKNKKDMIILPTLIDEAPELSWIKGRNLFKERKIEKKDVEGARLFMLTLIPFENANESGIKKQDFSFSVKYKDYFKTFEGSVDNLIVIPPVVSEPTPLEPVPPVEVEFTPLEPVPPVEVELTPLEPILPIEVELTPLEPILPIEVELTPLEPILPIEVELTPLEPILPIEVELTPLEPVLPIEVELTPLEPVPSIEVELTPLEPVLLVEIEPTPIEPVLLVENELKQIISNSPSKTKKSQIETVFVEDNLIETKHNYVGRENERNKKIKEIDTYKDTKKMEEKTSIKGNNLGNSTFYFSKKTLFLYLLILLIIITTYHFLNRKKLTIKNERNC